MAVDAIQAIRCIQQQPKDHFGAFCESIAADLRRLPPERAEIVKFELAQFHFNLMNKEMLMVGAFSFRNYNT